ncbi:hypothetical protein COB52_03670 [Candidatus Kaiserbacteria bacterium]|nr:MAG: hypothetical protein COB52_03670 [Candidatus Kaiserbacteria bacterium]
MKVAITGHTSGIGEALSHFFSERNDEIIGLSRSNGFDITQDHQKLIDAIVPADIFICNAFEYFYNVEILFDVFERWRSQEKWIINVSSDSADYSRYEPNLYSLSKMAIDQACLQLQSTGERCRVVNIRPGYVDTPRVAEIDALKMNTDSIVRMVAWVLALPEEIYLKNMTFCARKGVNDGER